MPLPLTKTQALAVIGWMKKNFLAQIAESVEHTPFTPDLLCAMGCQETGPAWLRWIHTKTVEEILQLCVFDAAGDFPKTQRAAFPRNTRAFELEYGQGFTNMLLGEANRSRNERGLASKSWVYKKYGIYQYDLRHIRTDEIFFREKQWYSFTACLQRAMQQLMTKWGDYHDVFKSIRAFHGSGSIATEYANNVMIYASYSQEVAPSRDQNAG